MANQGEVRFIRKNGRVIPIRSDGAAKVQAAERKRKAADKDLAEIRKTRQGISKVSGFGFMGIMGAYAARVVGHGAEQSAASQFKGVVSQLKRKQASSEFWNRWEKPLLPVVSNGPGRGAASIAGYTDSMRRKVKALGVMHRGGIRLQKVAKYARVGGWTAFLGGMVATSIHTLATRKKYRKAVAQKSAATRTINSTRKQAAGY